MGSQESVDGSYRPPVFRAEVPDHPPHTIMRLPVHTAVCWERAPGALVWETGVHVSLEGLYRAPVSTGTPEPWAPPQTIISEPVQTALSLMSVFDGAPAEPIGVHVSVLGW